MSQCKEHGGAGPKDHEDCFECHCQKEKQNKGEPKSDKPYYERAKQLLTERLKSIAALCNEYAEIAESTEDTDDLDSMIIELHTQMHALSYIHGACSALYQKE